MMRARAGDRTERVRNETIPFIIATSPISTCVYDNTLNRPILLAYALSVVESFRKEVQLYVTRSAHRLVCGR